MRADLNGIEDWRRTHDERVRAMRFADLTKEPAMPTIALRARVLAGACVSAFLIVLLMPSAAVAASPNTAFGFNARGITGVSTGAVDLTGGGAFDAARGFVHSGGGFSCTNTVTQGPLTGCLTGQGVRWDTANLLGTTMFKCTASETLRPAATSGDTAALSADFYRAGDGNDESFTANMIVTTNDLDRDLPGIQNVWIQGVGCATAITHFSN
jgi:hypothetical protein